MVFIITLIYISRMISDIQHLFIHLFTTCISSTDKCLFKPLAHFIIGLVWLLSCRNSIYVLEINHLSDICLAVIFSHFTGILYFLLIIYFSVQIFSFEVVPFVYCCFISSSFVQDFIIKLRKLKNK